MKVLGFLPKPAGKGGVGFITISGKTYHKSYSIHYLSGIGWHRDAEMKWVYRPNQPSIAYYRIPPSKKWSEFPNQ